MTAPGQVWAVLLARTGPTAKTRLAPVLSPTNRAQLAFAMFADVLDACLSVGFQSVTAVLNEDDAARFALDRGARVARDAGTGMNRAVETGLADALEQGADTVVILPTDLPLVAPSDLLTLIAQFPAPPQSAALIVPDETGDGTNALLVRPAHRIRPSFGLASAQRHLSLLAPNARVVESTGLAFDLDLPSDLYLLRKNTTVNRRTRQVLDQIGPPDFG